MIGRVIAVALVAAFAGQQVRDNAPVPTGTSTIAGRVFVDGQELLTASSKSNLSTTSPSWGINETSGEPWLFLPTGGVHTVRFENVLLAF